MSDLLEQRGAVISACGRYRYRLWRVWDVSKPPLVWVMLNPSTADADHDDPTIVRCRERARRMGAGGITVINLFAWRATSPGDMKAAPDPFGPANRLTWCQVLEGTAGSMVIAAWGVHGTHADCWRGFVDLACEDYGFTLYALALTAAGQPRHPLYIPAAASPFPWWGPEGRVAP